MTQPIAHAVLACALAGALSACSLTTAHVSAALPEHRESLAPPDFRLILVGDAGAPRARDPVLAAVTTWAARTPQKTMVLFLGDNAYPRGLVPDRAAEATRRLQQQLEASVPTGARVVFVPGNHDWDKSGPRGLNAVREQARLITSANASFAPSPGCPGPAVVPLPSDAPLRVLTLDTQWWLHKHLRETSCPANSPADVAASLRAHLDTDLPVVVAAHHPLATHGPHGGFDDWKAWTFPLVEWRSWLWLPLPGVGPLLRAAFRSDQDLVGRRNKEMVRALNGALSTPRPSLLVYAAGHEHSLQVLNGVSADYVLVSGTGSSRHSTRVGKGQDTLFAQEGDGFMVLDARPDGVRLAVVTVTPESTTRYFALARRR